MNGSFLTNLRAQLTDNINIKCIDFYENQSLLIITLISKEKNSSLENYIINTIKNTVKDINVEVKWSLIKNKEFNKSYVNNLIKLIKEKYNVLNTTESLIYFNDSDQELVIEVPNIIIEKAILNSDLLKSIIDRVYIDCNIKVDVSILINNNISFDNFIENSKQRVDTLAEEKLKANPIKLSEKKTNDLIEDFYIGKKIKEAPVPINSLNAETFWVTISGDCFGIDIKPIKNNKYIVSFYIHDLSSALTCKAFWSEEIKDRFINNVKEDDCLLISGKYSMDSFANEYVLFIESMTKISKTEEEDNSINKRVELRVHTQMSNLEGFTKLSDLYGKLKRWGHSAVGITDIDVVQAYPEAMNLSSRTNIKTIYGLDANVVTDYLPIVSNYFPTDTYVVFDIETTGLANQLDKITEIGAVKIKGKQIVDRFSTLVNPEKLISEKIIELTGITNEMVADKPKIDTALLDFLNFCEHSTLVAHNAEFDISNIRTQAKALNIDFDFPYVDTLYLARFLMPDLKNHRLNTLAKRLNVVLTNHHRAVDDAEATANIFIKLLEELDSKDLTLNENLNYEETDWPKSASSNYNMLILVKNQIGLKNLYKIVSESHTQTLYKGPRINETFLFNNREGLLLGSGNINGLLYTSIFNSYNDTYIEELARKYDFLEIQPRSNFEHLVNNSDNRYGIESLDYIDSINSYIVELGNKLDIPVVVTGDVFYLNKGEDIFRKIVKSVQFKRSHSDSENLYLKSTEQMLDEFSYLGKDIAYEIVVTNSNIIANSTEDVRPIPKGKFPPLLDGAEEELRKVSYEKAHEIYGDILPEIVGDRLETELNSIISNGYAALYMIARKLILKSNEDGYVVGSRGSVGSSFAATMAGITEVNPLAAHYICPNCKNSEFFVEENYDTGLDMEDKLCPNCGADYNKDGHNIPFEVFLGFEGNKEPDIDLNFAGEYQSTCHKYTEELFGDKYVFRAGTIGTIAENTAFGYIKKYYEAIDKNVSQAEVAYLQKGIVGTKRTTGQHPGGIMVISHENDIEDFTPINYPADDPSSGVLTTHFTYKAIDETILKLDLLGHDVPTIIKDLKDLTGVDPEKINLNDKKTMSIFSSLDELNLSSEISEKHVGTLGIPEFGTNFVRQMLKDTRPTAMGELFRISGLSHGTDVWLTNAQELVNDGRAVLSEVICTRDDIMTFLIQRGLDSNDAFVIMESVRKGRGLTEEQIEKMSKIDIPNWYIDSCLKIKYMFPKAHATAYVLMSFRIAYFKVHYPTAFYATFFTTKLSDFSSSIILSGLESVRTEMNRIKNLGFDASNKEVAQLSILELAEEMYARGYEFEKPKLDECEKEKFSVSKNNKIILPYSALDDVSSQHSIDLYNACQDGPFISIEDLLNRSRINKTALEGLRRHGLVDHLQETNQIDIFSMFD